MTKANKTIWMSAKMPALALLILIGLPLLTGQVLRLTAATVPPPGQLIDVGGYKLHINCAAPGGNTGDGLPTVIMEAGAGVSSPFMFWIQQGVSATTKVCTYDRAGLGWSEESGLIRDARTITSALHTLLEKAEIERPFVYVGHSIAGLYMRDYVERYPDDVAGLVFLDPSHPRQLEMLGVSEGQMADMIAAVEQQIVVRKRLIKLGVAEVYNPDFEAEAEWQSFPEDVRNQAAYLSKIPSNLDTVITENRYFAEAARQANENRTLGDRPVVVISATEKLDGANLPTGLSSGEMQRILLDLHKDIAALSSRGIHVEIDTANHMSLITNRENAAKVVPYITEVVQAVGPNIQNQ